MENIIKEGALRLMITESTCDVILSCSDLRLMAHKLILSVASPVFRELLQKCPSDSTSVLILPDVSGSIMSTILDYIYTGRTLIYSQTLDDFLAAANFLKIAVDMQHIKDIYKSLENIKQTKKRELIDYSNSGFMETETRESLSKSEETETHKDFKKALEGSTMFVTKYESNSSLEAKSDKKLPDLLPIEVGMFKKNVKMCNAVVPSPWCQRRERKVFEDPKIVTLKPQEKEFQKTYVGDSNNNMESESTKENSKRLENIIRHLHLNNSEGQKDTLIQNYEKEVPIKNIFGTNKSFLAKNKNVSVEERPGDRVELPKFTNFPFSRHLTELVPFSGKYLQETADSTTYSNDSSFCNQISKFSKQNWENECSSTSNISNVTQRSVAEPTSFDSVKNLLIIGEHKFETKLSNFKEREVCSDALTDGNENCNRIFQSNAIEENSTSDSSNDDTKEVTRSLKKKQFNCQECGKSFSQLRNYKYHRSVHEGTKEFSTKCPECGKIFNDKGYLSSHLKIHRDKKEYECPHCPKRFNQRVAYNMHLRIHTGLKPHECPTCGKSFSRKMLLKQHQRVHTGERPYSCPECGKTFADRSNMSLHTRLHSGVKPYACNVCPKTFTKKHHLKTHMNFHTGLKPYKCENCSLAFSQSSNMRTHYKKCILKDKLDLAIVESLSSADNNSS